MARRGSQWVLAGSVALLVVAIVTVVPTLMVPSTEAMGAAARLKAENDVRTALLQALGALFLAAGLFYTARSFALNRQGQITDRFTKAVDQLGRQDAVDVRIGGVFALERIAVESSVDRRAIIEVLTAFVRHRSPWPADHGRAKVPPDAQSAVIVLGRIAALHRTRDGEPWPVDLSGVDLRDGMFDVLELPWADLRGSHFEGATLRHANLEHCRLHRASFQDAKFGSVKVTNAHYSPRTTRWPVSFDAAGQGALAIEDEVELGDRVERVMAGRARRKAERNHSGGE